jgi:hypothetical protein
MVDYEEDFYSGNSSAIADTHTNMRDGPKSFRWLCLAK